MIHYSFFATLFSLCAGMVSITVSLFFYLHYKKKVIIWYTAILGMIILLLVSRMMELYWSIVTDKVSSVMAILPLIIEKVGYAIGMVAGPRFCFYLIGMPFEKQKVIIFNILAILYLVIAGFEIVLNGSVEASILRLIPELVLLFGSYMLLCGIVVFKLDTIGNMQLRKGVKLLFILSLIILPFSLIKYFRDKPYLPYHLENSVSLCLITVGSIFFALQFFNQPLLLENGKISEFFRRRYGTTSREEEIILCILQGLQNAAIADKLYISVRTVESHLYNIFQKTGVKNRVQLMNLLLTNSSNHNAQPIT